MKHEKIKTLDEFYEAVNSGKQLICEDGHRPGYMTTAFPMRGAMSFIEEGIYAEKEPEPELSRCPFKQTYECLAFMKSAIKCGEPWTGTAEAKYEKALKELESDWDPKALKPNAQVEPRRDSDAGSDALFGISVGRVNGFRSQPAVNTDEDMVRVVLDMPKATWRKLKNLLPPNNKEKEQDQ